MFGKTDKKYENVKSGRKMCKKEQFSPLKSNPKRFKKDQNLARNGHFSKIFVLALFLT